MKSKMEVKVKTLHENAVIPKYAKEGDAGLDLTVSRIEHIDYEYVKYYFGLAFEIPKGYVSLLIPRSSCYKQKQLLINSVGVIDSGYRGEVSAIFKIANEDCTYKVGERACQMIIMPYPEIELIEVKELSESERGDTGYGSSGK